MRKTCSIEDCDGPVVGWGWCRAHYKRWRRYGSPTAGGTRYGSAKKFIEQALSYRGDECLLWPYGRNRGGYAVSKERCGTTLVSRYICIETNGAPADPRLEAAHSCSNGHNGCITPSHLYWATSKENGEDTVRAGNSTRGERNARAKISTEQALEILQLKGKMPLKDVAEIFGVCCSTVCAIQRGKSWAWLNEPSATAKFAGSNPPA